MSIPAPSYPSLDMAPSLYLPDVCAGVLVVLFIPFLLYFYFFRSLKEHETLGKKGVAFGRLYIFGGFLFFVLVAGLMSEYYYYHDYWNRLFFLLAMFVVLVAVIPYFVHLTMTRVGKEHRGRVLSILLWVLVLLLVTTPVVTYQIEVKRYPHDRYYELEIETGEDNEYTLFFPGFYHTSNTTMELSQDHVTGNCSIRHVQENGTFLRVDGKGPVSIYYHYEGRKHYHFTGKYLGRNGSADEEHREEYLIFYESASSTPIRLSFEWRFEGSHGNHQGTYLSGEIRENGWQAIGGWVEESGED